MSYRDPLDAAMAEVRRLETDLARKTATEEEVAALGKSLEQAQREVRRLGDELPDSKAWSRRPFLISLYVGLGLALATAVAGSQSESFGMMMSYLAVMPFGFFAGGMIGAEHSRSRGWALGVGGAILALVALMIFFASIWPSL